MKNTRKMIAYIIVAILILVITFGGIIGTLILRQSKVAGHLWGAEWDYLMIDGQMYNRVYSDAANLTRKDKGKKLGEIYDDDGSMGFIAYKAKRNDGYIIVSTLRDTLYFKKTEPELNKDGYEEIFSKRAYFYMQQVKDCIILDVRTREEYDEQHIKGAICIPNEEIEDTEPKELPDKDQLILVYCRSGNRSKQASKKLAQMGYTNIKEFGGIIDWEYDKE